MQEYVDTTEGSLVLGQKQKTLHDAEAETDKSKKVRLLKPRPIIISQEDRDAIRRNHDDVRQLREKYQPSPPTHTSSQE